MAITRHLAQLIVSEHLHRPITGNVLLLGRQVVFMTPDQAQALVERHGVKIRSDAIIEYDKNDYGRSQKFISDSSFFSLFCDARVRACDVSDVEKADLIFDLSGRLPDGLEGSFDFIYNGSVLDNVFDPAACIRNVARMLKPSGVVLHYEGALHCSPAYLKFTPEWFFDFYALNGYDDSQTYFCTFGDVHADSWKVFEWDAFYRSGEAWQLTNPINNRKDSVVIAIAQNSAGATFDKTPIQGLYRQGHDEYVPPFLRYARSDRREVIRRSICTTGIGPSPTPSAATHATAKPGFRERILAYGRGSSLKQYVPPLIKNRLRGIVTSAGIGSPETPGYRHIGSIG